ncbi:MAG: glutamine--tRNA ligase [Cycloclasticus sp. symbiont of Poecilosclerida sp. M]|nr:MAG: glutamine--tRNA ligase [Cycloclasticus sp. symbiont of Poecilosclerida sp. M]
MNDSSTEPQSTNFIRSIIDADLASGKHKKVITRFPPEPNGYLHIGHAKSICLNFGIAQDYPSAVCHLRFDDTNPGKEKSEYIDAIKEDVRWLGFSWDDNSHHTSDYFDQLYAYAVQLVKQDKAYVDSLSAADTKAYRGNLTEPGIDSPFRGRSIEENIDLLERMKTGEFAEGEHVLRAKIDMAAPNMNMRDPAIYRIKHMAHPMTGDKWHIYPMYDFAHCVSDAIEGITHSLCTLEFEDHRPLYDWFLDELKTPAHPQQIEFSRLNLDYTVMSKRKLYELVEDGHVHGWNDPRLPTLSGMRRRGYTANAIRDFCSRIGVTKKDNIIEMSVLENSLREDLNSVAPRALAVLDPIKLIIDNYPEDQEETLAGVNHPKNPDAGTRDIPFSKTLYIELSDYMDDAPKKFFRLTVGREVRLRFAYYVTCTHVVKDDSGNVTEVHCRYDPETRGGKSEDGRKVKGTIHWVSAQHAVTAEVRLYDRLFTIPAPVAEKERDFKEFINIDSAQVLANCQLEASLLNANTTAYQFERQGYFCLDSVDSKPGSLVFNRIVTLRDSWAKKK